MDQTRGEASESLALHSILCWIIFKFRFRFRGYQRVHSSDFNRLQNNWDLHKYECPKKLHALSLVSVIFSWNCYILANLLNASLKQMIPQVLSSDRLILPSHLSKQDVLFAVSRKTFLVLCTFFFFFLEQCNGRTTCDIFSPKWYLLRKIPPLKMAHASI